MGSSREHGGSDISSSGSDGESAMSRGQMYGRGTANLFPEPSFNRLHEDLTKFSWTLQLEELDTCLRASATVFESYSSCSRRDQDNVNQLCKFTSRNAFKKGLTGQYVRTWKYELHVWVLKCCKALLDAAVAALSSAYQENDWAENESKADVVAALMESVTLALDGETVFAQTTASRPLPPELATAEALTCDDADDGNIWLRFLADHFQRSAGVALTYENLLQMLHPSNASFNVDHMHSLLSVLEKGRCLLNVSAVRLDQDQEDTPVADVLHRILDLLLQRLESSPKSLTTSGDPTHATLSAVFAHLYSILSAHVDEALADSRVSEAQRRFVDVQLRKGNFNAMLAAVREITRLLDRGRTLQRSIGHHAGLKNTVDWITGNQAVTMLLRVNMHQRQYVQAVLQLLLALTDVDELEQEHIALLWDMLQQEGMKDVVKGNVALLLREVAVHVGPELLTVLVDKVPSADVASVADAQAIFALLGSICRNKEVENWSKLVHQCLDIGWQLLLSPAAGSFVICDECEDDRRSTGGAGSALDTQDNLLAWLVVGADEEWKTKNAEKAQLDDPPFVAHFIQRCLGQVNQGAGLFESLHTLIRLIRGMPKGSGMQGPCEWAELIERLDVRHDLLNSVLSSLERYMSSLTPQTPPDFGRVFAVHMELLQLLITGKVEQRIEDGADPADSGAFMSQEFVQRLWTTTITRIPPAELDTLDKSYAFFSSLVSRESIDPLLLRPLLEGNAARKPASTLSKAGLTCMYTMTQQLNLRMGLMAQDTSRYSALPDMYGTEGGDVVCVATGTGKLISMDYIFEALVNGFSEDVAAVAMVMLVETFVVPYTAFGKRNNVWEGFVRDSTEKLRLFTKFLTGYKSSFDAPDIWLTLAQRGQFTHDVKTAAQYSVSARRTLQLLHYVLSSCCGKSMPVVTAHCASARGEPLRIVVLLQMPTFTLPAGFDAEVEVVQGNARVCIRGHTHMYVGYLRKWLSGALGMPLSRVSLVAGGRPLRDDQRMVKELLTCVGDPPVPATFTVHLMPSLKDAATIAYTELPDDVKALILRTSPDACMSRDDSLYELLLYLLDLPPSEIELHAKALQVLSWLPTWAKITATLSGCMQATEGAGFPPALLRLLNLPLPGGEVPQKRPGALLYTLEALYALYVPSERAAPGPAEPVMLMGCPNATTEALIQAVTFNYDPHLKDGPFWTRYFSTTLRLLKHIMQRSALPQSGQERPEVSQTNDNGGDAMSIGAANDDADTLMARPPAEPSVTSLPALEACSLPTVPEDEHMGDSVLDVAPEAAGTPAAPRPLLAPPSPSGSHGSSDKEKGAPPAAARRAADSKPVLEIATLCGLLEFCLAQAASIGARLADTTRPPSCVRWSASGESVSDTAADQLLLQDILQLINGLLKANSILFDQMIDSKEAEVMIRELLLHPVLPELRVAAHEMLRSAVLDGGAPHAQFWLLSVLSRMRPAAVAAPQHCLRFYNLCSETVQALMAGMHEDGIGLAFTLLTEEMAALEALAAAEFEPSAAQDSLLLGQLTLLCTLWEVLSEHYSVVQLSSRLMEVNTVQRLHMLLDVFLFPEAKVQGAIDSLPPASLKAALLPRCGSPETRAAAYTLLQVLVRDRPDLMVPLLDALAAMLPQVGTRVMSLYNAFMMHPPRASQPDSPDAADTPCKRWRGLKNAGATCYMNCLFQQLFMQPTVRALILRSEPVPELEERDSVFAQVQIMFANLAESCSPFYVPAGFWQAMKDYDGAPINVHEHQDAHEFLQRLQDTVDMHLKDTGQPKAIYAAMGGAIVQSIICKDVPYESVRTEPFYQVSVDVQGMGNLDRALDSYFQEELMEGDNAYYCEQVKQQVTAMKRIRIQSLPHTLAVHLKRFEFDFESQNRDKIKDRFEFPHKLDMFKYTPEGTVNSRSRGGAAPSADGAAAEAVRQHPPEYYTYFLKGVVVHSGNAFAGHYYSYVKERPQAPGQEGQWLCFDDTTVTEWDPTQLDADCFGGRSDLTDSVKPNSAFMLFYERASELEPILINPQLKTAAHAPEDVAMEQPRGEGDDAAADAAAPSGSCKPAADASDVVPWDMPLSIYQRVMNDNLVHCSAMHLTDPKHAQFITRLVAQALEAAGSERHLVRRSVNTSTSSGGVKSMSCDTRTELVGNPKRVAVESDSGAGSPVPRVRSHSPLEDEAAVRAARLAVLFALAVLAPLPQGADTETAPFAELAAAGGGCAGGRALEAMLAALVDATATPSCPLFMLERSARAQAAAMIITVLGLLDGRIADVPPEAAPLLDLANQIVLQICHACIRLFDSSPLHTGDALELLDRLAAHDTFRAMLHAVPELQGFLVKCFGMVYNCSETHAIHLKLTRAYVRLLIMMLYRRGELREGGGRRRGGGGVSEAAMMDDIRDLQHVVISDIDQLEAHLMCGLVARSLHYADLFSWLQCSCNEISMRFIKAALGLVQRWIGTPCKADIVPHLAHLVIAVLQSGDQWEGARMNHVLMGHLTHRPFTSDSMSLLDLLFVMQRERTDKACQTLLAMLIAHVLQQLHASPRLQVVLQQTLLTCNVREADALLINVYHLLSPRDGVAAAPLDGLRFAHDVLLREHDLRVAAARSAAASDAAAEGERSRGPSADGSGAAASPSVSPDAAPPAVQTAGATRDDVAMAAQEPSSEPPPPRGPAQ